RGLAAAFDAPNTAGWVRDLLHVTFADARRMVQLAKAVDGDLAATGQALAEGRISAEHAQVIARAVAELPDEAAPWVPQAAERTLLDQAEQYDPRVLGKIGREILAVVDPDHGDELLGRQLERENRAAEEGRQLNARPCGGSRVRVTGWFDAEGWQTVSAALDPLAAPRPADSDSSFAVMPRCLPRPGGWSGFLLGWGVRGERVGIWWRCGVRRSLVSMSAVEGLVLVRYQGRRARCSVTSSGSWPAVAYQQTVSVRQVRPNGTVRSTARALRLWAWPTPTNCLASSMAT